MPRIEETQPLPGPPEVSGFLGIPEKTLAEWRYQGKGPRSYRVGKHVRYRWSDVEQWLDEQARG